MSKTIQVREVPDEVHSELRRRALAAGTSLSQYVADELTRIASRSNNAEVLLRSAQRDWSVSPEQIIGAIDEGRSSR